MELDAFFRFALTFYADKLLPEPWFVDWQNVILFILNKNASDEGTHITPRTYCNSRLLPMELTGLPMCHIIKKQLA